MGFNFPWRKKEPPKNMLEVVPLHTSSHFKKYATVLNGKILEIETWHKTQGENRTKVEGKAAIEPSPSLGFGVSRDTAENGNWNLWRHPNFDKLLSNNKQLETAWNDKVTMLSGTLASTIPTTIMPIGEQVSEITPNGTFTTTSSTGSLLYQLDETKKEA